MEKYIVNPDLCIKHTDGNDIIGVLKNVPAWFKTSNTGLDILEYFKTENTTEGIVSKIAEIYGLSEDFISDVINHTIACFIDAGILIRSGTKNPGIKSLPEVKDMKLQQLWINLTNFCNLTCKHCFVVRGDEAEFAPKDKIFRLLKEAAEAGINEIAFSGGEPTLHPDFFEIIKKASKIENCSIKLITNATVGFRDNWKELVESWLPYINDFQVSIDGIDAKMHDLIRGKGSFDRAVSFIEFINEKKEQLISQDKPHDFIVGISFTPTVQNISSVKYLYKFAFENKADYLHLNRAKKPALDKYEEEEFFLSQKFAMEAYEEYDKMKDEYQMILNDMRGIDIKMTQIDTSFDPSNDLVLHLKQNRCGAGFLTLAVNPNGDVYPCSALINRDELFVGNIFEESLARIHEKAKTMMEEIFSVEKNKKCRECDYKYFCGGGCRATAASLDREDNNCEVIQNRYMQYWSSISLPLLKSGIDYTEEVRRFVKNG